MPREERPGDGDYYERERVHLFSQGDIFQDVPLNYPTLGAEVSSIGVGRRAFLSGPLEPGFAMLITATCSMRAQGITGYAHLVRTLVPIISVAVLEQAGLLNASSLGLARKYDNLYNYMYLPAIPDAGMAESLALLYMPVTLSHGLLELTSKRSTQLSIEGARQLQRKLVLMASAAPIARAKFQPAMD